MLDGEVNFSSADPLGCCVMSGSLDCGFTALSGFHSVQSLAELSTSLSKTAVFYSHRALDWSLRMRSLCCWGGKVQQWMIVLLGSLLVTVAGFEHRKRMRLSKDLRLVSLIIAALLLRRVAEAKNGNE